MSDQQSLNPFNVSGHEFLPHAVPMDAALPETERDDTALAEVVRFRLTVSLETILYSVFIVAGAALRLIQIGTVVLSDGEAREALSVFRALNPQASGLPILSSHPLMFAANSVAMSLLGIDNWVVRMPTVLVGIALILSPLFFRRQLGRSGALICAGLLAVSPVLMTASRTMSGPVWTIALVVLAVWAVERYRQLARRGFALLAAAALGLAVLGAEGPGFLVVLMLLVGIVFALSTADDPDRGLRRSVRELAAYWPWVPSLVTGALALGAVGTVFLLNPGGAASIGEVISRGLQGFIFRQPGTPVAFPLLISLFYEPGLWIFGLVGVWLVFKSDDAGGFVPRVLVGWLVAAVVACLVYPGAGAEHALWLTVPLIGLSSISLQRVLAPVHDRFWNVPTWGPWLHGVGVIATLTITGINLLFIGRGVLTVQPSLTPPVEIPRVMLALLTVVLLVILFFLVGSVWGSHAAWRGMGIGVLLFLSIYSFSSGWRASVNGADDPREPWRPTPTAQNLALLEEDLRQASLRVTGMPYEMPISVQWPDDGAVAWILRRFPNLTYINVPSVSFNGPAIILRRTADSPKDEKPQLGAGYVGTDLPTTYLWDRSTMQYWDFLAWIYERETRVPPTSGDRVALWLRADVYGAPPAEGDSGSSAPQQP